VVKKILKIHGYTKQKIRPKSPFVSIRLFKELKFTFVKTYLSYLRSKIQVLFFDESIFRPNDMYTTYFWTVKRNVFKNYLHRKPVKYDKKSFQLLLCVSPCGFYYYEILEGSNNNETLITFLNKLELKARSKLDSDYIIYMDNASIHHHQNVKAFLREKEIKIIYGVKHYSDFNLCELFFGKIKSLVRKSTLKIRYLINKHLA